MQILVAEDDRDMREMISLVLRNEGHEVLEVAHGRALLDVIGPAIVHGAPLELDLIISDVRMPGLTGLEVLAGLRGNDWRTPFILITGFGDYELHREAARLGARVLDKPFDPEGLRREVQGVLAEMGGVSAAVVSR